MNIDVANILNYFHRHSSVSIPYCMQIASPNPGPHVVITGGTHGNEPAGVKAIVELHHDITCNRVGLKRGKISFLLGNPKAFEKDVRYLDCDLNRHFTKPDASKVEGVRALEIKAFLGNHHDIEALLDLHSVSIGDFILLVYPKGVAEDIEFALKVSSIPLHFVFHAEHMPGTLIEAARSHHIPGLIVECGNHYAKQAVDTARLHIYSFLATHLLIEGGDVPREPLPTTITIYESIQAIKPQAGFKFLIEDIKTGTRLKKGQKFAKDDRGYHIAPQDCHVVVPSLLVKPTDEDAGFLGRRTVI
jgi:succinylglutamate desuccinylase